MAGCRWYRGRTRPAISRFSIVAAISLIVLARGPANAQQEARLLRFPNASADRVAFTFAGDLYTAPLTGGQATRLTSHPGMEVFARFSPDGRSVAFSGEYAGTRQVYIVPAAGGQPTQLTFYPDVGPMPPRGGFDNLPVDWTTDGSKILVRMNRTPFGQRVGRYYLVDPRGGLEMPLEIPEGATGATYDPTGQRMAYNIKSREWRHWKRYSGGRQQDVWIYDLANHSSRRITEFNGTDDHPMWVGDKVYFVSDRGAGRKLNLWVYDTGSGDTHQVTFHTEYDVLWPSRGAGGIVYENGGYIWHLDPRTGRSEQIHITLAGDLPQAAPYYRNVRTNIDSWEPSPSGRRALFTARGEIFTVPAEHGDIRNLSGTPGERERDATWSPDGRSIAYLSDATGEYQLYIRAADGTGSPRRLTRVDSTWITNVKWSPDSKWISYEDNRNRLAVVEVSSGRETEIDRSNLGSLSPYAWSADSKWIAYAKNSGNTYSAIWLYSFDGGTTTQVTGDDTNDTSPAFDPGGRFLYFTSARDFVYRNGGGSTFQSRIYVATLRPDVGQPFPPRSDEEPGAVAAGTGEQAAPSGQNATPAPMRIQLDGLGERVAALPGLPPGNYAGLVPTSDGLLYFSGGSLQNYSLADREAKAVLSRIRGYSVTPDGRKVMYQSGDTLFGIVDARPGQNSDAGRLDLDGMRLRIEPRVEWAQIFHDAWLIERDFFYDPGMHGVDWNAMFERYRPLIDHVATRADLDYVLGELIGELNVGHAYITPAPGTPSVDRVPVALLGAEFRADGDRYRISNIFPGENWHEEYRSPLTEPGIDVRAGQYLIAIDGEDVTTSENPYRFLVNKADRTVRVTVNDRPTADGATTFEVRPVTSELGLRYQQWVRHNAHIVDSLSNGRIGYVHLPNTSVPGYRELYEHFPPQDRKEAMILDDRYNGGGFIPEEMAFVVGAPLLNFWARRHLDLYSQPAVIHTGPKAVLINGQSSSGGDAFPYYFRELGLGPLVGERTWGGLVGISGNPGFVDGGGLSVPRFAFVNPDGEWDVEGMGDAPDIEVLDRPEEIAAGREPIIERAVQYLLDELKKPQYTRPGKPAGPKRGPGSGGNGSGGGSGSGDGPDPAGGAGRVAGGTTR